jgi:hypothetical protein
VGLTGVLPDDHHRDKYKENVKIQRISFWNLSNDFYYDVNSEQDFLSKRRTNSSHVCTNCFFYRKEFFEIEF